MLFVACLVFQAREGSQVKHLKSQTGKLFSYMVTYEDSRDLHLFNPDNVPYLLGDVEALIRSHVIGLQPF